VHVNDVVHAFVKSTTGDICNATLNIGTGKMVTLQEVAEIMKEHFPGVNVNYEKAPDDATGAIADVTLARSILNFSPIDPEQGIRKHVASCASVGGG